MTPEQTSGGADDDERDRFIELLRVDQPLSKIATSLGYADSAGLRYRMRAMGITRQRVNGAIVVEAR